MSQVVISILFVIFMVASSVTEARKCGFPAIFNFGDSNSDTGGLSAAFGQAPPPNGITFFHTPAGRFSDGRLVIDFIGKLKILSECCSFLFDMSLSLLSIVFVYNRQVQPTFFIEFLTVKFNLNSKKFGVALFECLLGLYWFKFQQWSQFCNSRINHQTSKYNQVSKWIQSHFTRCSTCTIL